MKVRNGFVSNSSSSSFILAVDSNADEIVIRIPIEELEMFISGDETGIDFIVKTEAELNARFVEECGYGDVNTIEKVIEDEGDWVKENYVAGLKMINEGKTIVYGSVSYHDRGLNNFLQKLGATIGD